MMLDQDKERVSGVLGSARFRPPLVGCQAEYGRLEERQSSRRALLAVCDLSHDLIMSQIHDTSAHQACARSSCSHKLRSLEGVSWLRKFSSFR